MASYNMNEEIKEIAALTGKEEKAVGEELRIRLLGDGWTAWNRSEEKGVKRALADTRDAVAREDAKRALAQKLEKGACIWRKVSGEWLVQVTGQEVEVGDMIRVERKDGTVSDELVSAIVATTEEGVFVRVGA
jgi:hypothetical protein